MIRPTPAKIRRPCSLPFREHGRTRTDRDANPSSINLYLMNARMRGVVGVSIRRLPELVGRGRSSNSRLQSASICYESRTLFTTASRHSLLTPRKPAFTKRVPFSTMHRSPAAMVTKPLVDPNITINTPRDPNTLSNYHNFVTRNTSATFDIDFEKKVLKGNVVLTLESLTKKETKEITLDTSFLNITDVKVNGEKVEWEVKDRVEPYGSPLKIELKEGVEKGKTIDIAVCYPLFSVWAPRETF